MKTSTTPPTPATPGTMSRLRRAMSTRTFRRAAAGYVAATIIAFAVSAALNDPQAEVGAEVVFLIAGLPWSLVPLIALTDTASADLALPVGIATSLINAVLFALLMTKLASRHRIEVRSARILYYLLSLVAAGVLFPGTWRTYVTITSDTASVPAHSVATLASALPDNVGIEDRYGNAIFAYDPANPPTMDCAGSCVYYPLEPTGSETGTLESDPADSAIIPPSYDLQVIEQVEMPLGQRVPFALLAYGVPTAAITYGLVLLTRLLQRISGDPAVFDSAGAAALTRMRDLAVTVGVSLTAAEVFQPQSSSGTRFDLPFAPFIVAAGFSVLAYIWRTGVVLRAEAESTV